MPRRERLSFSSRRRRELARKVASLEKLESRSMITESFGLMMLGIGVQTSATIGSSHDQGAQVGQAQTGAGAKPHWSPLANASEISIANPAVPSQTHSGGGASDDILAQ